jgi:hypothetical protein
VKARKFFLFEDHRGDSFPEQEHGCGRATRAATDNEYVYFHDGEEELKDLCLVTPAPRSGCSRTPKSHATIVYFHIDHTYTVIKCASEMIEQETKLTFPQSLRQNAVYPR